MLIVNTKLKYQVSSNSEGEVMDADCDNVLTRSSIIKHQGCWVVYIWDAHPVTKSVHEYPASALMAMEYGDSCVYLRYGQDLTEAIKDWNGAVR